jgi:hypothetical protein
MMFVFAAFLILATAYPVPKYYDLVITRCGQDGYVRNPNCNKTITWKVGYVQPLIDWEKPFVLADNCNLTKRRHINETTIMPYIRPFEAQLAKNWYSCGDCKGNCTKYNPVHWFLTWANVGVCSNWTIPEYFINGLLMFERASGHNWYSCCDNAISECHIPHTPDLKPLDCYWPPMSWGLNK